VEFDECPCTGRNLDRLIQPAVLTVLSQRPVHGYRIVQGLSRMPLFRGRRPDAAGVYRFLKALEDRGLVSSAWDLSGAGPAKRRFKLLPKGAECLARWLTTLEEYREQVSQLIHSLRQATGTRSDGGCGCRRTKDRKATPGAAGGRKTKS
jgi:DNA-binding PadR family transcriptional regulator